MLRSKFYRRSFAAVLCADQPEIKAILPSVENRVIT